MTARDLMTKVYERLNDPNCYSFPRSSVFSAVQSAYAYLRQKTGLDIYIPVLDTDTVPGACETAVSLACAFLAETAGFIDLSEHFYACAGYPVLKKQENTYGNLDVSGANDSTNIPQ